ncbi:MAG: hypothetical protein HY815_30370 [Candidatus Riflebacteria bacterium]|nr:hypothetical protein [Candidatus Riflebacteria bacterium]
MQTQETNPPRGLPTYLEIILFFTFVTFLNPVPSDDLWWHLACGREFLGLGGIPRVDEFSRVSAGAPWTAHYWLWCVAAAWIQTHLGLSWLLAIKAAMAAVTLWLVGRIAREQGIVSSPAFVATLVVGASGLFSQFWNLRAQNVTALFTVLMTWLFFRYRSTGRLPWVAAPLVMLIWVNAHGGYVFGLVVWGAFAAAAAARWLLEATKGPDGTDPAGRSTHPGTELGRLVALGALMAAAASVNPYGPAHLLYPFGYLGNVHLQTRITEWAGTVVRDHPMLELDLVLLVVLALAVPARWTLEELVLVSVGLHFAFQATRNLFLIGPWVSPLIGRRIDVVLRGTGPAALPGDGGRTDPPGASPPRRSGQDRATWAWLAIAVAGLAVAAVRTDPRIRPMFPDEQIELLKRRPAAGPLFNEYSLGGLVFWHLYPRYRPFIDGRADLHIGSGGFVEYLKIVDLADGWQQLFLEKYRFRVALLERGMPLERELKRLGWLETGPPGTRFTLLEPPPASRGAGTLGSPPGSRPAP